MLKFIWLCSGSFNIRQLHGVGTVVLNAWHCKTRLVLHSFLTRTCRIWNRLPPEVYPLRYDMRFFKKHVKSFFKAGNTLVDPQVVVSWAGITTSHFQKLLMMPHGEARHVSIFFVVVVVRSCICVIDFTYAERGRKNLIYERFLTQARVFCIV